MKIKRLAVLLCALLLVLSAVSLASAENESKYFGYSGNYATLKNGQTLSFYVLCTSHSLYDGQGNYYQDVIYDCEGPVKATVKSGSNWIKVTNTANSFIVTFSSNYTLKARTGKIVVKGKGYKATMKFTQYGTDKITSVKRSKKTVTMKFKLSSGAKKHFMYIYDERNKVEDGVTWYTYSQDIHYGPYSKTSYKFKVQKDHYYYFGIGPAIPYKSGSNTYYHWDSTSWGGITVHSLTGTQNPDYLNSYGN